MDGPLGGPEGATAQGREGSQPEGLRGRHRGAAFRGFSGLFPLWIWLRFSLLDT